VPRNRVSGGARSAILGRGRVTVAIARDQRTVGTGRRVDLDDHRGRGSANWVRQCCMVARWASACL
jgi:hypothetical protein